MMHEKKAYLNDVLFVLYAAEHLDWVELTRTNFQKILYFCATLSPLINIKWGYDFTNANYGPFNGEVHRATDIMVHYRYAEVTELTLRKNSTLTAQYRISELGTDQVRRICQLNEEKTRLAWISTVMKILNIYGNKFVTKLAYREPTFSEMRKQNRGGTIDLSPEQNRSLQILGIIGNELDKHSIQLDTLESKLITYFDFISKEINAGIGG